jgi:hypothetical protein
MSAGGSAGPRSDGATRIRVHDVGVLEGFVPAAAPKDGMVLGSDGRWVALGPGGVLHARQPWRAPVWSRHGRMLYAAVGATLAGMDALTGDLLWTRELAEEATAMFAAPRAVHVATGGALVRFDHRGAASSEDANAAAAGRVTHLACLADVRWIGGVNGVWRSDASGARRIAQGVCRSLDVATGAARAVVDGAQGPQLVEDDGAPMVWPFFSASEGVAGPCGAEGWWILTEGRPPHVVDRQRRVRWGVRSAARLAAASDACVICVTADAVVLTGPTAPPLRLPVDDPGAVTSVLAGDGMFLVVTAGATRGFVVEGS